MFQTGIVLLKDRIKVCLYLFLFAALKNSKFEEWVMRNLDCFLDNTFFMKTILIILS